MSAIDVAKESAATVHNHHAHPLIRENAECVLLFRATPADTNAGAGGQAEETPPDEASVRAETRNGLPKDRGLNDPSRTSTGGEGISRKSSPDH